MRVLITGAHITPAQAVIEELKLREEVEIIYVGRKTTREGDSSLSIESELVPKLGVKFIPIITGRLQRTFTIYTIPSLLKIPIGFLQALFIVLKYQPDVILSFGGYVSVPVVVAGWLFSVPIITHEQTLVMGLANSISNLFSDKMAVSFLSEEKLKTDSKVVLTGNPIRKNLIEGAAKGSEEVNKFIRVAKKEKKPLILITCGNQGSHIINEKFEEILTKILDKAYVVHQTGDSKYKDYERIVAKLERSKYKERYLAKKWIEVEDMSMLYRNIDICVGRAGANTLLELAYFEIPSLVIPIPYIYKNEQMVNAKFFNRYGLCQILEQNHLTGDNLNKIINEMLKNLKSLKEESKKASDLVIHDASKRLVLETLLLVNKYK